MASITLRLKKLGKRKIKLVEISTETQVNTLTDLIEACVRFEVDRYNNKKTAQVILPYLTPSEIQDQSQTGKVTFGDQANGELANYSHSLEVAIQGFKDGLYLVYLDDEEITTLDEKIELKLYSEIIFLRMTFLTGTFW